MNGTNVKVYSKASNGNQLVRADCPNFKVKEFACKDGSDTIFISDELVGILQKIRNHFDKPVNINSAYRTEAHNKGCGGATYSKHKYGMAADIVIKGVTPMEVAKYVETLLTTHGGIGVYGSFTHVDVRANRYRFDQRSGKPVVVKGF